MQMVKWVVMSMNRCSLTVRHAHSVYFQLKAALEYFVITVGHGIVCWTFLLQCSTQIFSPQDAAAGKRLLT